VVQYAKVVVVSDYVCMITQVIKRDAVECCGGTVVSQCVVEGHTDAPGYSCV
jgi:hypothetical protein